MRSISIRINIPFRDMFSTINLHLKHRRYLLLDSILFRIAEHHRKDQIVGVLLLSVAAQPYPGKKQFVESMRWITSPARNADISIFIGLPKGLRTLPGITGNTPRSIP